MHPHPADPDGIAGDAVRPGDRAFISLSTGAGVLVLGLMAAIAVVFIPIHALVPITVGGVVGLAMDRLTRRTTAQA